VVLYCCGSRRCTPLLSPARQSDCEPIKVHSIPVLSGSVLETVIPALLSSFPQAHRAWQLPAPRRPKPVRHWHRDRPTLGARASTRMWWSTAEPCRSCEAPVSSRPPHGDHAADHLGTTRLATRRPKSSRATRSNEKAVLEPDEIPPPPCGPLPVPHTAARLRYVAARHHVRRGALSRSPAGHSAGPPPRRAGHHWPVFSVTSSSRHTLTAAQAVWRFGDAWQGGRRPSSSTACSARALPRIYYGVGTGATVAEVSATDATARRGPANAVLAGRRPGGPAARCPPPPAAAAAVGGATARMLSAARASGGKWAPSWWHRGVDAGCRWPLRSPLPPVSPLARLAADRGGGGSVGRPRAPSHTAAGVPMATPRRRRSQSACALPLTRAPRPHAARPRCRSQVLRILCGRAGIPPPRTHLRPRRMCGWHPAVVPPVAPSLISYSTLRHERLILVLPDTYACPRRCGHVKDARLGRPRTSEGAAVPPPSPPPSMRGRRGAEKRPRRPTGLSQDLGGSAKHRRQHRGVRPERLSTRCSRVPAPCGRVAACSRRVRRAPPLAVSPIRVGPRGRRRATCDSAVMPAALIADALLTKGLANEGFEQMLWPTGRRPHRYLCCADLCACFTLTSGRPVTSAPTLSLCDGNMAARIVGKRLRTPGSLFATSIGQHRLRRAGVVGVMTWVPVVSFWHWCAGGEQAIPRHLWWPDGGGQSRSMLDRNAGGG